MSLLDLRVHKDRTPGTQVCRFLGPDSFFLELLDVQADGSRKSGEEGPAAGGTGLIELDGVDDPVPDVHSLHILAPDVQDEVHIGVEIAGRPVVGDGLHLAQVNAQGGFDEVLPVAADPGLGNPGMGAHQGVNGPDVFDDVLQGLALVGSIRGKEDLVVLTQEDNLGGGGSGINAQVGGPGIGGQVLLPKVTALVVPDKVPVFLFRAKEGVQGLLFDRNHPLLLQALEDFPKTGLLRLFQGHKSRTQGNKELGILRDGKGVSFRPQGLFEPVPEAVHEVEGTA